MDNKQDKQFYWEVKDFLNRKPINVQKKAKPESLKESIQKMFDSGNALHTPKVLTEEVSNKQMANELSYFSGNLINSVNQLLSINEDSINKNTPECKAFTANNPNNIFSIKKNYDLTEAPAFGDGGGERPLTYLQRRERERYEERTGEARAKYKEEQEAKDEELKQKRANIKARQEQDKVFGYQKDLADATGGPLSQNDEARPGETLDDYMTRLGTAKRKLVYDTRETRRTDKLGRDIATRIETLAGKRPEELTAQETSTIMLDKIMMGGSNATPGLADKVTQNLTTSVGSRMKPKAPAPNLNLPSMVDTVRNMSQQVSDNLEKDTKTEVERLMNATIGRTTDDLRVSSRDATEKEIAQREQEMAAEQERYRESQYQRGKGKTIMHGLPVTYDDFESMTGHRYGTQKGDHDLLTKIKEYGGLDTEASQLALTTSRYVNKANQERAFFARKQGAADRKADDTFFNNRRYEYDPEYREETKAAETAAIKNSPQFKAEMTRYQQGVEAAVQKRQNDQKTAAESQRRAEASNKLVSAIDALQAQNAADKKTAEEQRYKEYREKIDALYEPDRKEGEEIRAAQAKEAEARKKQNVVSPETDPDTVFGPSKELESIEAWKADNEYENEWRTALGMERLTPAEEIDILADRDAFERWKAKKPASRRNETYSDFRKRRQAEREERARKLKQLENEYSDNPSPMPTAPGETIASRTSSPSLINSFTAANARRKPVSVDDQIRRLRGFA